MHALLPAAPRTCRVMCPERCGGSSSSLMGIGLSLWGQSQDQGSDCT